MKVKRRMVRPKTPNILTFRLTADNLEKFKKIQNDLMLDNKNLTMNYIISNYFLYEINKQFIEANRKLVKNLFLNEINKVKYANLFKQ